MLYSAALASRKLECTNAMHSAAERTGPAIRRFRAMLWLYTLPLIAPRATVGPRLGLRWAVPMTQRPCRHPFISPALAATAVVRKQRQHSTAQHSTSGATHPRHGTPSRPPRALLDLLGLLCVQRVPQLEVEPSQQLLLHRAFHRPEELVVFCWEDVCVSPQRKATQVPVLRYSYVLASPPLRPSDKSCIQCGKYHSQRLSLH